MTTDINSSDDMIDVRDVIARFEELEGELSLDEIQDETNDTDEVAELRRLRDLLEELRGNGGDEQWRGAWYPITMVRDSHFKAYAEELAEDCGMIQAGATWPNNCIDWDQAADQLKQDYTTVEFDSVTYWYR